MNNIFIRKRIRIIFTFVLCFVLIFICTGQRVRSIIRLIGEGPEHTILVGQEESDPASADRETQQENWPTVQTEEETALKEGQVVLTDRYGNTSGEWGDPIDVSDPSIYQNGKIGDESASQTEIIAGEGAEEVYVTSPDEAADDDRIYVIPNGNSQPDNEDQTPETEDSGSSEDNGEGERDPHIPIDEIIIEETPGI